MRCHLVRKVKSDADSLTICSNITFSFFLFLLTFLPPLSALPKMATSDLYLAIKDDDVAKIKDAIRNGAVVNYTPEEGAVSGQTPLIYAALKGTARSLALLSTFSHPSYRLRILPSRTSVRSRVPALPASFTPELRFYFIFLLFFLSYLFFSSFLLSFLNLTTRSLLRRQGGSTQATA